MGSQRKGSVVFQAFLTYLITSKSHGIFDEMLFCHETMF